LWVVQTIFCLFWVSNPLCLSSSSAVHFSEYFFLVQHPDYSMTGRSLHMQWPLTSQTRGSFLKDIHFLWI
jgi:hypothetical protein